VHLPRPASPVSRTGWSSPGIQTSRSPRSLTTSRRVAPGTLFRVAFPGATVDGHDLRPTRAVRGPGAVALLVERPLPLAGRPRLRVPSVAAGAGARFAATLFEQPRRWTLRCPRRHRDERQRPPPPCCWKRFARGCRRFGVGGGRHVGRAGGGRVGRLGRGASHHSRGERAPGAARADARHRRPARFAMEVLVARLGPVPASPGTWFRGSACFTNLSHEHLDFHGTLDRVLRGEGPRSSIQHHAGAAAVNIDDAYGVVLAERGRGHRGCR